MSAYDLMDTFSPKEIAEWQAYWNYRSGFGEQRMDYWFGTLAGILSPRKVSPTKSVPRPWSKFLPRIKKRSRQQNDDEIMANVEAFAKAIGR